MQVFPDFNSFKSDILGACKQRTLRKIAHLAEQVENDAKLIFQSFLQNPELHQQYSFAVAGICLVGGQLSIDKIKTHTISEVRSLVVLLSEYFLFVVAKF